MKLRVTIDTDECSFDSISESMGGVIDIDNEGVAHWWYKCPSYFITFKDVEIIECNHESGTRRVRNSADTYECHNECHDCGSIVDSEEYELLK